jgi:signal peptidase II
VLPFFNIVMVWNKGVSFGLFNDFQAYGPIILSAMSVVIAAVFTVWLFRSTSKFQSFAIALVLSGAVGNVIDRIRFGAVVDFLDFHAYGYHYPAFNVADSCIVVGVVLLMIHAFFLDRPLTTDEKDDKTNHEAL